MKFPAVEFLETAPKFRKRKKILSLCVYVLHKTCHQEISRPSRAVTEKKCTKRCSARAELLFWLLFDVLVAVAVVVAKVPHCYRAGRGGGGGEGLYGEALPKRGTFFRMEVHKRVGISPAQVYKRGGKTVI